MKHRAKFDELGIARRLLQGTDHPGRIATDGSISNLNTVELALAGFLVRPTD